MTRLPEKFPEYSIMYKTLTKKIQDLELMIKTASLEEISDIQNKINSFELERQKIEKNFQRIFLKI